jgi:hypothetical protein
MEEVQRGTREAVAAEATAEVGQEVTTAQDTNPVYAAFIAGQLARQDERKRSLESRGITVVTTSGVLATLLLGFVSFTHAGQRFVLPENAHQPVKYAVVLFTAAAVAAVLTNLPLPYGEPSAGTLKNLLGSWDDTSRNSEIAVASAQTKVIEKAKSVNNSKAILLFIAVGFEVGAVASIADAVVRTL